MKGFFIWVSIPLHIEVQLPRSNKKERIQIEEHTSILKILEKFNIKPDTCLTLINNKPIPVDTIMQDEQTLILIEVTSGGWIIIAPVV